MLTISLLIPFQRNIYCSWVHLMRWNKISVFTSQYFTPPSGDSSYVLANRLLISIGLCLSSDHVISIKYKKQYNNICIIWSHRTWGFWSFSVLCLRWFGSKPRSSFGMRKIVLLFHRAVRFIEILNVPSATRGRGGESITFLSFFLLYTKNIKLRFCLHFPCMRTSVIYKQFMYSDFETVKREKKQDRVEGIRFCRIVK